MPRRLPKFIAALLGALVVDALPIVVGATKSGSCAVTHHQVQCPQSQGRGAAADPRLARRGKAENLKHERERAPGPAPGTIAPSCCGTAAAMGADEAAAAMLELLGRETWEGLLHSLALSPTSGSGKQSLQHEE
jgi:hypothetical protein